MPATYISEAESSSLLNMATVMALTEEAFRSLSSGTAYNMPRQRMRIKKGALHLLPAAIPYKNIIGYKAYTSFKFGVIFKVYLHSAETGQLLAVIDANDIGRYRTGAASGVATKYLAKDSAKSMFIFGTGFQAESQLEAILSVRKLDTVFVSGRKPEKAAEFAEKMSKRFNINVSVSTDITSDLLRSDIITTITTASSPLFDEKCIDINRGVHINAAGGNSLIRSEINEKVIDLATIIATDNKEVTLIEAGDILSSLEKGRLHMNEVIEIGDIANGFRKARVGNELTIFLSQGMGILDLIVAEDIYQKALKNGLGKVLPF